MYCNKYAPIYTPPEERDFLLYLDDLKYEETVKNTDKYFQDVKVINFDMICHMCSGDPLERSVHEHLTIQNSNFKKYLKNDKKKVVGGALQIQDKTKQQIFIKKTVLEHFLNK